jgi:hypothetical protein
MTDQSAILVLALTLGIALAAASYKNDHVLGRRLVTLFSGNPFVLGMVILIVIAILFAIARLLSLVTSLAPKI